MKKLVDDFVKAYQEAIKSTISTDRVIPSRVLFLRPSQLPFCPIAFFINHAGVGMYRSMDLAGSLYVNMGTSIHNVLQKYLAQSGKILGNYKCHECGKLHKLSYQIECCDFPTLYQEIEIDWKGVHGHIDAVYNFDKNLYIGDYKSTSVKQIPNKKLNPGIAYREQIETYAYLFEKQYKLKITGIFDAFIVRDNPNEDPVLWARPFTDKTRLKVADKLKKYKKMHQQVLDVSTKKEAIALLEYGRCSDTNCTYCRTWNSDSFIMNKLEEAFYKGKQLSYIPIRGMAERALSKPKRVDCK